MSSPNDLTTVAAVQQFLGSTPQGSQKTPANLEPLVTTVSSAFLAFMERATMLAAPYTETRDGLGATRLMLRQYPLLSVSQLLVRGTAVPQVSYGTPGSGPLTVSFLFPPGYGFLPALWDGVTLPGKMGYVTLAGGNRFPRLPQCVQITYKAGYLISNEAATLSSSALQVTPQAPLGRWAADGGVTYANGTPLVAVPASPSSPPIIGQYVPPSRSGTPSAYQFSAADGAANAAVLYSYSFIPYAVEQACISEVAELYRYADRVGVRSLTEGGQQTAGYSPNTIPQFVKDILQPFKRVTPVMGG